jgi:hypothetical protein
MFIPDLFVPITYRVLAKIALNVNILFVVLISSFVTNKINRPAFACFQPIIIMVIALFLPVTSGIIRAILIFLLTTIFAFGLLGFFNFFKNVTTTINRGRVAGITAFIVLPTVFLLELIPQNSFNNLYFLLLTFFLNAGSLICAIFKNNRNSLEAKSSSPEKLEKRVIFLYSIPWILFSIANVTLAQNISSNVVLNSSSTLHIFLIGLQAIGVNVGALLAGFLSDFYGRKFTLILSLTLYGISAVIQGVFNNVVLSVGYFTSGISWGLLFVLYSLVIFGDLSNKHNSSKIYAIGLLTYFSATTISLIYQVNMPIITMASLLTCFVVFLSVIPVFLAPELISTDLEKMKMKKYLKTIKRYSSG